MELSNSKPSANQDLPAASFADFHSYVLSDAIRKPAQLAQREPREIAEFVAERLRSGDVPLPRVLEAHFGKERWGVIKDLVRKLDVEPTLWVIAAAKFYDDPMAALQGIAKVVSAQHVPELSELGKAFFDRSQEFFVKRCGIQGSIIAARIPAMRIEDLFIEGSEHSGNTGRAASDTGEHELKEDSGDEETDPSPNRWSGQNLWDNVVRVQESSEVD